MPLAAPYCDFTPDCFWEAQDETDFQMSWRLERDRLRYKLIDAGWTVRGSNWSHVERQLHFFTEELAMRREAASPTAAELRLTKRIYTGIEQSVFQKIGRNPTGLDQLLYGTWSRARREIEIEYVRRYGCCGDVSEAAEHRGVCQRVHKPARLVFLERQNVKTFVGECATEAEETQRTREFFLMCELCPRLIAERLVRDMTSLIAFDTTLKEARETLAKAEGELGRMLARASAIQTLEEALNPYQKQIMALQNNPLGFKTDQPKGYPWEIVRTVIVIGLLNGFSMTENEINIIAGGFYGAQSGYYRLLRSFPGLANFRERLGVPAVGESATAIVSGYLEYDLNGITQRREFVKTDAIDLRIPVRVNAGMGPDAVLGKAKRKAYKMTYEELTNMQIDDSGDDDAFPAADSKTIEGTATSVSPNPAIGNQAAQAEPLKQHEKAWLESCQAGMDKAENIHQINTIVDDTKKRKPPMTGRVEAMAVEARKRFGSNPTEKREPAAAGVG